MSKYRFREIEKYKKSQTGDTMELEIPLPKTPSGKVRLFCPNDVCSPRAFLLGDRQNIDPESVSDRKTRRKPGESGVTCPYCGTDGFEQDFISGEDREAAIKEVEWAFVKDTGDILDNMIKKSGFGKKGSFISMEVKKPRNSRPRPYREDLLRNIDCGICNRNYGVYAIGVHCPDCGGLNISEHFTRERKLIVEQIDLAMKCDDSELSYRLLGNAHEDVLTAFETYLKTIFRLFIGVKNLDNTEKLVKEANRGNPFQNIERAQKLYQDIGIKLLKTLDEIQERQLHIYVSKRHIVGHNLSLVDEKFSTVVDDHEDGTTVAIVHDEVKDFIGLCEMIVNGLIGELPELS